MEQILADNWNGSKLKKLIESDQIRKFLDEVKKHDSKAYIAGGSVVRALLNKEGNFAHDIDLFCKDSFGIVNKCQNLLNIGIHQYYWCNPNNIKIEQPFKFENCTTIKWNIISYDFFNAENFDFNVCKSRYLLNGDYVVSWIASDRRIRVIEKNVTATTYKRIIKYAGMGLKFTKEEIDLFQKISKVTNNYKNLEKYPFFKSNYV